MNEIKPKIESSWAEALNEEFSKDYFLNLKDFLKTEKKSKTIYPPGPLIFNAFDSTPFDQVKVVILGQDPYHGVGQAHGLCFSVQDGIKPPPSLMNIFKELQDDLGIPIPKSGNLQAWAKQGVLLLNSVLTVRSSEAASHAGKGWEIFTDAAISALSKKQYGLVFILWGNYAKQKSQIIDNKKHHILTAAHPSPFSAYNGFMGCKHFSKTNEILKSMGKETIDWSL